VSVVDERQAERARVCAELGHPGATFNPWFGPDGQTWCACGQVTTAGNTAGHITCCGGPLDRRSSR
jgi:hypothetical protein